jgi:hypothetical protein
MNPAFPARFPFEMFHRIGDINLVAIDSGFFECTIQNLSRRTDKRFASHIFVITRLLTDHEHRGLFRPFAEDGLCRFLVERAGGALFRRGSDFGEAVRVRHRRGRPDFVT